MSNKKVIKLGSNQYNAEWLRSVTEEQAVRRLRATKEPNQIKNAWKQANGLSVRNYDNDKPKTEAKKSEKPKKAKTKKTEKK